jgi:hypothetical protein
MGRFALWARNVPDLCWFLPHLMKKSFDLKSDGGYGAQAAVMVDVE